MELGLSDQLIPLTGLVIAALTFLFSFKTPRFFQGRGAYFLSKFSINHINQSNKSEDSLKVQHGEELIDGPVFTCSFFIENKGRSDIIKENFNNPIKINFPDEAKIISLQYDTPAGLVLDVDERESTFSFAWDILKPNEKIDFQVLLSCSDCSPEELSESIQKIARLIDADGLEREYSLGSFAVKSVRNALILGALFLATVYPANEYFSKRPVVELNGEPYVLQMNTGMFSDKIMVCKEQTSMFEFQECSSLEELSQQASLSPKMRKAYWGLDVSFQMILRFLFGFILLGGMIQLIASAESKS